MTPELEAFETARADRAKRTDYAGHRTTKHPKSGAEIVDMKRSKHRTRDRHEGTAADLARAFVAAHPELQARYESFSLDELVGLIDVCRDSGNDERRIEIDAWLMATYPPQHLTGVHTGTEADR